ncbi:hypothetical protein G9A89_007131 [Geosiphon pyriformis]|nr:hypothetical protein G9A89_007131 [Geosiphon pyriformis]
MSSAEISDQNRSVSGRRHNKNWNIAVTSTDRYIGNTIARGLLCGSRRGRRDGDEDDYRRRRGQSGRRNENRARSEVSERREHRGGNEDFEVRALTQNLNDKNVQRLEYEGAEVRETDFDNDRSLDHALRNVDWLVWVAESNRDRVNKAEKLARAARRNDVRNVVVLSVIGANEGRTATHREFEEIERIWREEGRNVVILRSTILQQVFLLWSEQIQDGYFSLPLDEDRDEFAPVNLCDVTGAIANIITENNRFRKDSGRKHQVYELTGPESLSPGDIVDILNDTLGREQVEYEEVNPRELQDYLRSLNEGHEGPRDRDNRRDGGHYQRGRRGDGYRGRFNEENDPLDFLPIKEFEIEKILDLIEYARENKVSPTDDIRRINGREPESLEEFFRENIEELEGDGRRGGRDSRRDGRRGDRDGGRDNRGRSGRRDDWDREGRRDGRDRSGRRDDWDREGRRDGRDRSGRRDDWDREGRRDGRDRSGRRDDWDREGRRDGRNRSRYGRRSDNQVIRARL